ncbi:hypothetical protein Tco_1265475 [Tanacetum coccineum]
MIEPEKPSKKKDQIKLDEEMAKRLAKELESYYELAQRLQVEEHGDLTIEERSKLFVELMDKRNKHFAKLRDEEIRRKPPTKAQKRNQMYSFVRIDSEVVEGSKSQVEGKIVPRDDEAINVESLATKYLIVDWKTYILTEDKMYYEIIRDDGSTKLYKMFTAMLDDFDRQDMLDLYRLVKERFETTSQELYDKLLWGDLITLFEPISTTGEDCKKYSKSLLLLVVKLLLLVLVTTARRVPATSSSRSHTLTRTKGKEIAKPVTPLSESAYDEDMDSEQAQRDKDMNDRQSGQFGTQRTMTVARARETIDEQELEAHYMYMVKIQEVPTTESRPTFDVELLEKVDSSAIPDSSDMCDNDGKDDKNAKEYEDERVVLANLIENLKLDTDENKTIQKKLKKANASLAHELKECKYALTK